MLDGWFLSETLSDGAKALVGGLLIGLLFGAAAQTSKFCLRSACIEFWSGKLGGKVAVWLLVFGTALAVVQFMMTFGDLADADIRQIRTAGTVSGAVIGGLLFGAGMILARGCASRLLVLSATGNLRALVTGLVVTIVAQASLTGVLAPLREGISALWLVGPELRDLGAIIPAGSGMAAGAVAVLAAFWMAANTRVPLFDALAAAAIGVAVAAGWLYTASLAALAFDPVPITSVTFTGPSADTLFAMTATSEVEPSFGLGLVPGVFLGSLMSSVLRGEFRVQRFDGESGMVHYLVGAVMMGFGGMLAGGCAVGAGVTGGAVLSLTAWVALGTMWLGAGLAILFERGQK